MSNGEKPTKEERVARLRMIVKSPDYMTDNSEVLREHLDDPEPEMRKLAIEGLWDYPEPGFIAPLMAAAQSDPGVEVRCRAIVTLGRYVYEGEMAAYDFDFGELDEFARAGELPREDWERVKTFLLDIYRDESKSLDERRFAVEALSFCADDEVLEIIQQAYDHAETPMKLSAIFAMGRNGNLGWTNILLKELYNPDRDLQLEAIRAAGEAGLTEAGKDLWRLTYADEKDVQLEAVWALGQSGWEGAFERLDELSLDSPDSEVRETAEAALEEWYIHSGALSGEMFDENGFDVDNELNSFMGAEEDW